MATFILYVLPLLLLPLYLYLIFFTPKKSSDDLKNLLPGSKGWPVLGETVELALVGLSKFVVGGKSSGFLRCKRVFMEKLLEPFSQMASGLISLPGTAFNRGVRGGKAVRGQLLRIVEERRRKGSEGGDCWLSKLLLLTDEDGKHLSDRKIANFFLGLLLGSYEATAYTITAVIYYLAQLPHIYQQVFEGENRIDRLYLLLGIL
ncbi:beta-amyrin 6-beta-monooxygenase-like [Salvia miltiorrhiza]|uniref:beta-amyrin 6-beta-monooxygenase-like n=1 Tax=Salvia miltiorrhiza TaxID=226208 RepID=UPI0025AB85A2|nr:beta-amyrin 6-beta-monooxygenase-like [Salvia miltiorrhiza]